MSFESFEGIALFSDSSTPGFVQIFESKIQHFFQTFFSKIMIFFFQTQDYQTGDQRRP